MAAVVKSHCQDCGPVAVWGYTITLAVWPECVELSSYSFLCPKCHTIQTWPASYAVQSLLAAFGGVKAKVLRLPEPEVALEGVEPLTVDDLIDTNLTLREHDKLTELLEGAEDGDHAEEG